LATIEKRTLQERIDPLSGRNPSPWRVSADAGVSPKKSMHTHLRQSACVANTQDRKRTLAKLIDSFAEEALPECGIAGTGNTKRCSNGERTSSAFISAGSIRVAVTTRAVAASVRGLRNMS